MKTLFRVAIRLRITGKRKRGRPKNVGLRAGEEEDRAYWNARIYTHTGDPR